MIYLDNAATTPMSRVAVEKYNETASQQWGNASALHAYGLRARDSLLNARDTLLTALDGRGGKLLFTSGGTESDNLAVFGCCGRRRGGRVLVSAAEHAAVDEPCKQLLSKGYDVVWVRWGGSKEAFLENFEAALTPDTVFCSVMAVNNETGQIFPIREAASLTHRKAPDALFHTDAVQAFGKLPLSVRQSGVDLCSVSGHKIGGPQGVGALWLRDGVKLSPLFFGGHQQESLRPGTEPVPLIAAFAAAAGERLTHMDENLAHARQLRAALQTALSGGGARLNGEDCSPWVISLSLPELPAEVLMRHLEQQGILVSAGAACAGGKAGNGGKELVGADAKYTIRISTSTFNTQDNILALAEAIREAETRFARQIRK